MNKIERIEKMNAVNDAIDFEAEQAALAEARYVDLRPSLPAGAVDLFPGWKDDIASMADYQALCKDQGAGFDRGARRYVIRENMVDAMAKALTAAGFLPCIHPSLLMHDAEGDGTGGASFQSDSPVEGELR